jgi:hypothetical protein
MSHAEARIDWNTGYLYSRGIHTAGDSGGTSGSACNTRQVDASVQPHGVRMLIGYHGYDGRLKFATYSHAPQQRARQKVRGYHDIRSMQSGVRTEIRHDAIFKSIKRWPEWPAIAARNIGAVVNRADHTWCVTNGAKVAIAIHGAEPTRRVFKCLDEGGLGKLSPCTKRVVNRYRRAGVPASN